MTSRLSLVLVSGAVAVALSACAPVMQTPKAYWQRVEDGSALWMTGPKAQQALEQNIAGCVREVDELVELGALRETTPPDTHGEYHRSLNASGDLAYFDTPTRHRSQRVAHTEFYDFESCMRSKGWERVKFVRYETARQGQQVYQDTQDIRVWGVKGDAAKVKKAEKYAKTTDDFKSLNK